MGVSCRYLAAFSLKPDHIPPLLPPPRMSGAPLPPCNGALRAREGAFRKSSARARMLYTWTADHPLLGMPAVHLPSANHPSPGTESLAHRADGGPATRMNVQLASGIRIAWRCIRNPRHNATEPITGSVTVDRHQKPARVPMRSYGFRPCVGCLVLAMMQYANASGDRSARSAYAAGSGHGHG